MNKLFASFHESAARHITSSEIIRDRKAGAHGSLDDSRGAQWGVCGRLARSQRHWHRPGFRRRGYRQHEPQADQSRLRLGSPGGEQAGGRRQRRTGLSLRTLDGPRLHNPDDEESLAATYDNGIELIKERGIQLDWEDMERLVAGLLKAVGYCARAVPKGPDGGRDVVASPDALGLESPRIVAEVKHRKGAMGAPAVRSFVGGLRMGDRGLYVSTGGFTKEARYEADRANVPIRPLDLDAFVCHYVEVYDRADDDTRSILPLTRI